MLIRPALPTDAPALWQILAPILRAAETYALDPNMSESEALAYWLGPDRETFVAEDAGQILGTYYLRPNHPGPGSHVANCGYMVRPDSYRRGIARAMGLHSLDHARQRGFRAMQFNFVVSSNTRAVSLWQSLGFQIVGRLPHAFHHPSLGYVDAFVMFRPLADAPQP